MALFFPIKGDETPSDPAFQAVIDDNVVAIAPLLDAPSEFEAVYDGWGRNLLMWAAHAGSHKVAKFLLERNPDWMALTDVESYNALHYAVQAGNVAFVKQFSHLITPKIFDRSGEDSETPVGLAAINKDIEMLEILAALPFCLRRSHLEMLQTHIRFHNKGDLDKADVIKVLSILDAMNPRQDILFDLILMSTNIEKLKQDISEMGSRNLHYWNSEGNTWPLRQAVLAADASGDTDMVSHLLSIGVDPNFGSHYAGRQVADPLVFDLLPLEKPEKLFPLLVRAGLNVYATNANGDQAFDAFMKHYKTWPFQNKKLETIKRNKRLLDECVEEMAVSAWQKAYKASHPIVLPTMRRGKS